ncbi:MAG: AAA family ATPase [Verrucomicrobiales bacterium]|nr:AAA family ATPase [Verrucomicrobiales bacterium]
MKPKTKAPIIHINGFPGTGKLTVARCLKSSVGARVLDNHSIYNVAFCLLDFGSPEFKLAVEKVEEVAYAQFKHVPSNTVIVITNCLFKNSDWSEERWRKVFDIGSQINRRVGVVVLECSEEENKRRLNTPERNYLGKLTDVPTLVEQIQTREILDKGADSILNLDTDESNPDESAASIVNWLATAFNYEPAVTGDAAS